MNATAIKSPTTRIVPARKANQITHVIKQSDGSLDMTFGSGKKGALHAADADLQAFAIWSILNPEARASK